MPSAKELLVDHGYDNNRLRGELAKRGTTPCIPPTKSRKVLDCQRHRIENTFGRLNDRRRVATRYDSCAHTLFSAVCIPATITLCLP